MADKRRCIHGRTEMQLCRGCSEMAAEDDMREHFNAEVAARKDLEERNENNLAGWRDDVAGKNRKIAALEAENARLREALRIATGSDAIVRAIARSGEVGDG